MSTEMIETRQAIADFYANTRYGFGGHTEETIRAGVPGVFLGYRQFDASRDTPDKIDFAAPLGEATGNLYVSQVLPGRPLHFNVVSDETSRKAAGWVSEPKKALRARLQRLLMEDALPDITDRAFGYLISDQAVKPTEDFEIIEVNERWQAADEVEQIALDGLTFVYSDYSGWKFAPGSLRNTIAIKLNHPCERRFLPNTGRVSLGGALEIDTNDPRQLAWANNKLAKRHEHIVGGLALAGAEVVSLVTGADGQRFDFGSADRDIAVAISNLQEKQN